VAGEPHPHTHQNHENATLSADWSDHHSTDDAADASTVTRQCCMPDVLIIPLACHPPPRLGPVGVSSSTLSGSRWRVVLHLVWVPLRVVLHPVWVPLACRPSPCLGPVDVSSTLSGSRCCVIISLTWDPSVVSCSTFPPACVLLLHHLPPWRRLSRHPSSGHGCVPFIFPVGRSWLFSHPSLCSPTLPSHTPYFTHPLSHPHQTPASAFRNTPPRPSCVSVTNSRF